MTERIFSITKSFFKHYKFNEKLKKKIQPILNRYGQFILCSAAFYNWDDQGISDLEIKKTIKDFMFTSSIFFKNQHINSNFENSNDELKNNNQKDVTLGDDWEAVIVKNNYQVWRQKNPLSNLYRYKVFGTFKDIPAKTFFVVQMDTEYRKQWDSLIIKLNILDKEKELTRNLNINDSFDELDSYDSGNEVLQWVMHYPYPMYSREYCYIRRAILSKKQNLLVVVSKSCDHPNCENNTSDNFVRVNDYESQMVIKPHTSFDENGFDYLLTYFDNPRAYMPITCYNWIATSGLPGFVENLHKAAIELNQKKDNTKDVVSSQNRVINNCNKSQNYSEILCN